MDKLKFVFILLSLIVVVQLCIASEPSSSINKGKSDQKTKKTQAEVKSVVTNATQTEKTREKDAARLSRTNPKLIKSHQHEEQPKTKDEGKDHQHHNHQHKVQKRGLGYLDFGHHISSSGGDGGGGHEHHQYHGSAKSHAKINLDHHNNVHWAVEHGHYEPWHGPWGIPKIDKHGHVEETPEVQHARYKHLLAHAQAHAHASGHHDIGGGDFDHSSGHQFSEHVPIIGPKGVPHDTPEVALAKAEHFAAHAKAWSKHNY